MSESQKAWLDTTSSVGSHILSLALLKPQPTPDPEVAEARERKFEEILDRKVEELKKLFEEVAARPNVDAETTEAIEEFRRYVLCAGKYVAHTQAYLKIFERSRELTDQLFSHFETEVPAQRSTTH
jgi:hypothetical protein